MNITFTSRRPGEAVTPAAVSMFSVKLNSACLTKIGRSRFSNGNFLLVENPLISSPCQRGVGRHLIELSCTVSSEDPRILVINPCQLTGCMVLLLIRLRIFFVSAGGIEWPIETLSHCDTPSLPWSHGLQYQPPSLASVVRYL